MSSRRSHCLTQQSSHKHLALCRTRLAVLALSLTRPRFPTRLLSPHHLQLLARRRFGLAFVLSLSSDLSHTHSISDAVRCGVSTSPAAATVRLARCRRLFALFRLARSRDCPLFRWLAISRCFTRSRLHTVALALAIAPHRRVFVAAHCAHSAVAPPTLWRTAACRVRRARPNA